MTSRSRRNRLSFRPSNERLEARLVMSGNASIPAEVKSLLAAAKGVTVVRPNTPVLSFESAFATATFIDPSDSILGGNGIKAGPKDYIAPHVTLDGAQGP